MPTPEMKQRPAAGTIERVELVAAGEPGHAVRREPGVGELGFSGDGHERAVLLGQSVRAQFSAFELPARARTDQACGDDEGEERPGPRARRTIMGQRSRGVSYATLLATYRAKSRMPYPNPSTIRAPKIGMPI